MFKIFLKKIIYCIPVDEGKKNNKKKQKETPFSNERSDVLVIQLN